jgi:hypothetical protein
VWFRFEDEDKWMPFKPEGELFLSDWRFDIFATDCAHVLLLQDDCGPYHIVAVGKLRDYLLGRAEPAHVVAAPVPPGEAALVHSQGRWVSPTEIEFVVGGETEERLTYRLSAP